MTPLDLARSLANAEDIHAQAIGVAIVARGLSDESPLDPFRQPWPVDVSLVAAAEYLDLNPDPELLTEARLAMPRLPDFMLNRRAPDPHEPDCICDACINAAVAAYGA